jgi:hypothetical protein
MYVLYDTVGTVPPDALQGEYEIMPNGAADSWNKPMQMQKAVARLQLLGNSPYWKRNELEKSLVEIDDPRLVKRAYQDPGFALQNQMEDQAQEISIMLLGFPAQVQPGDDDKAHVQSLQGYVDAEIAQNKPVTPQFATLALGHLQGHMMALDQKKDPNLNAVRQQVAPLVQYLQTMSQHGQQMPGNEIPGPGAQPQQPQEPTSPTDISKIQSDRVSDATKVANALAALMKSGVQPTMADINKTLTDMGLPPISSGQPTVTPQPVVQPPEPGVASPS